MEKKEFKCDDPRHVNLVQKVKNQRKELKSLNRAVKYYSTTSQLFLAQRMRLVDDIAFLEKKLAKTSNANRCD